CRHSAYQIEQEEARMAHRVLNIVSENPQIQHVAADMQKSRMQEHRADDREQRPRYSINGGCIRRVEEILGDEPKRKDQRLRLALVKRELPKEHRNASGINAQVIKGVSRVGFSSEMGIIQGEFGGAAVGSRNLYSSWKNSGCCRLPI